MPRTILGSLLALAAGAAALVAPTTAQAAAPAPGTVDTKLVVGSTVATDGSFAVQQTWSYPAGSPALTDQTWQYSGPTGGEWDWFDGGSLPASARTFTHVLYPTNDISFVAFGNGVSLAVDAPLFDTAAVNQTGASYSGAWAARSSATAFKRDLRVSTARNASASFTASASNIGVVAAKGPKGGTARVYVDGVDKGTVSLYSATAKARTVVFKAGFASTARHTVRIVNASTAAGRSEVALDGFVTITRS